jgi:MFS transporter, DHA2 family, multidrug resistance protein
MDALKTRRWWALGALTLAVLAVGLDGTVLSVALPTLATDLHANLPVVAVGLLAVTVLLPESRSATRTGLDPLGVLAFSTGLTVVVYGVIEAGQRGWGDPTALAAMAAGALVLIGFGLWERRLGRRPDGQPLVDLALFGSTSLTWGTIPAAVGVFALFGVLFTAPQYFQAILGTNAMGSGLRLLPLIGGLAVGASVAARAGVGSAVIQAVSKVGAPFAAAILGRHCSTRCRPPSSMAPLP